MPWHLRYTAWTRVPWIRRTHALCKQHFIYDIFDTANATRIRDLRDLNV